MTIPRDTFTPHGYLDNPYHSWKLHPSGVLRSQPSLGMGWHMPNLGSYVRNQFQYTAHLALALQVGELYLFTAEDFARHGCTIVSTLHTKNRFEYMCTVPSYGLTLQARYFLVREDALGCMLTLSSTAQQPLSVRCYLLHQHTHNPYTSRLWEHGLYALAGPEEGTALLGIASEGDVFMHGARSADGTVVTFGEMSCVVSIDEAARIAHGERVVPPAVTQAQGETGWQMRTVVLPCHLTMMASGEASPVTQSLNVVLARGVSRDSTYRCWREAMEEIARAEAEHQREDERFWSQTPQLVGDWPEHWRRGLVYDFETLRMVMRPATGCFTHIWDGMQVQAPREVLAEAAMDTLFLSYADPLLASDIILGHFQDALRPNLPCVREDGSYNMVADDGQICGTAPEWGFPLWCCDQLWLRMGDLGWLRRLYPAAANYLRWWLTHRRDADGYLVYACSWESGQDISSRFGPQQTGGTIIEHVRPVDLQASMGQGAAILARWAQQLIGYDTESEIDFAAEVAWWQQIANEFTVKTRLMWHDGWFRDYDSAAGEWSSQLDTMHLAPLFCGVAGWGHSEQVRPFIAEPPAHSGWAPLSWPPVMLTLVGAAEAAEMYAEAAEHAWRFIEASYRSTDSRELDEHGGLPGVTREYRRPVQQGKWDVEYVNAGIEGYGWGAISIFLLLRYVIGLHEEEPGTVTVAPMFPIALRRPGAVYSIGPVQWGGYTLNIVCTLLDEKQYRLQVQSSVSAVSQGQADIQNLTEAMQVSKNQSWEWEGRWGDTRTLQLS